MASRFGRELFIPLAFTVKRRNGTREELLGHVRKTDRRSRRTVFVMCIYVYILDILQLSQL